MFDGLKFLEHFRARRLALLYDDAGEVNRATVVAPAYQCAATLVNEILSLNGTLFFVALSPERTRAFTLAPMSRPRMNPAESLHVSFSGHPETGSRSATTLAMCESVEAREGVSTGISASDRALTVSILGEPIPSPRKLVKPGHIFPVEVREGGVLVRNALPEGALDIVKLAGFSDAALFVDLLDARGELLSRTEQTHLASERGIPQISLGELTRFRLEHETLVYKVAEAKLPSAWGGEMRAVVYKSTISSGEHVALVKGTIDPQKPILTRVQPEFTFSDVFGGKNPPSRRMLQQCLAAIGERECGVFVYLRRSVVGQLHEQIASWQKKFGEPSAALMREYGLGAQILRELGVRRVELLTGSTKKLVGLRSFGVEIVSQIPLPTGDPHSKEIH